MGYTHYWRRPEGTAHDTIAWNAFVNDCKVLYKHMPEHSHSSGDFFGNDPLYLSGCFKYQRPVFNEKMIFFNGSGVPPQKRTKNEHMEWVGVHDEKFCHETFHLQKTARELEPWERKDVLFSYCKTARKPYDLMVQAVLILYKYYFPYVEISSDGELNDWSEAFKFVAGTLPTGTGIGLELLLDANEGIFKQIYKS